MTGQATGTRPVEAETEVASVRAVGGEAVALELSSPPAFDARPGQFVRVAAPVEGEPVESFYTISSPYVRETVELTIDAGPDSTLGRRLAGAAPGEAVTLAGPFGSSYYEGEPRLTVVAGGPGVGPAVGIGERAVDEGAAVAIVYADDQPKHGRRLRALAAEGADVTVSAAIGERPVERALSAVGGQAFVYGYAAFVDRALAALESAGIDPDGAKVSSFG